MVLSKHRLINFTYVYLQFPEEGFEFFAKGQVVTLWSVTASYGGSFDNRGAI